MFNDTPLVMVEDKAALAQLVEALASSPVIGIDTESNSMYAHRERVCLIQFSTMDTDWILDPLKVKDLSSLGDILADPDKPTVLHGADYDIRCLKRDYGFQIRGLFDTLIAAQMLGMPKVGLADLITRFFGYTVDKQFQRHDWGKRPLYPEHLDYARGDTHFLLALRELLTTRLKRAGRLAHATEECSFMEELEPNERPFDPNDAFTMKGSKGVTSEEAKRALRALFIFREKKAEKLDRPTFKVIPNHTLVDLAQKRPDSDSGLGKLLSAKSSIRRRWGKELLECIQDAAFDEEPLPEVSPRGRRAKAKKGPKGPKARLTGRKADRATEVLKQWRNKLCDEVEGFTSHNVISNSILRRIAVVRPYDIEEMKSIPEVRNWQVKDFGEQLLDLLDEVDPRSA